MIAKFITMEQNQLSFYICATTSQEQKIQELLCSGYSPVDLLDERIFNPPFDSQEVFNAVLKLNQLQAEAFS